jgi:hypothetical protein
MHRSRFSLGGAVPGSGDQPLTSPHENPERHGTTFGSVVVTVDLALGDCIVTAPQKGPICTSPRRARLNSLDEIRGAYGMQHQLAVKAPAENPHAADIARALEFAGRKIKAHQGRKRA